MALKLFASLKVHDDGDGGRYFLLPRRDVPLCFLGLRVGGGLLREPRGREGLADLASELLNEGPKGFKDLEWHRRLDSDALRISSYPGTLSWSCYGEALSEDRTALKDLLRSLALSPRLPKSSWKRIRDEALAEEKERWAQPSEVLGPWALAQALGRGHVNAREAHPASLARLNFEEARNFAAGALDRGSWFSGAAGGDLDEDEALASLRAIKEALPRAPAAVEPDLKPRPSLRKVWILDHPALDQAFLALTRPGILAGDPDRVALRLARYALGEGDFSSRLMTRLRTQAGQTYGLRLSLPEKTTPSPLLIQTFTKVESLGSSLDLILKTLEEVRRDGFTKEEIAAARGYLHGSYPLRLSSPASLLREAYRGSLARLSPGDLEQDWEALQTRPEGEVQAAARRMLGDMDFSLALVGPAERMKKQLKGWEEPLVLPFSTSPDDWPE